MQDNTGITERLCKNCGTSLTSEAKFCNNCGMTQVVDSASENNWQKILTGLGFFFGLLTLLSLIANFSNNNEISFLLLMDSLFIIITIAGVGIWLNDIKPILQWKSFNIFKLTIYSILAIISAVGVNIAVNWLNKSMFGVEVFYYEAFRDLKYAKLVTIVSIAVQPAIFEELAFRGVIQCGLSKVIDSKQTIFLTAFLFAILHMSIISLFWLIPFAVALGYLRNKENTLWYGVTIHFFFNATACFLEFFQLDLL